MNDCFSVLIALFIVILLILVVIEATGQDRE